MSISIQQYEVILSRLQKLENGFNDFSTALQRCATMAQVSQLLVIVQQELASLKDTVDSCEARITAIEEEPLS